MAAADMTALAAGAGPPEKSMATRLMSEESSEEVHEAGAALDAVIERVATKSHEEVFELSQASEGHPG